jgi:hypothetical protein
VSGAGKIETVFEGAELPLAFVATTETEYVVPLVKPTMVQLNVVDVQENDLPAAIAVAVYPVIAVPPLDDGVVHVTLNAPLAGDALPVGAPGYVSAVPLRDPEPLVPTPFVAVTLRV